MPRELYPEVRVRRHPKGGGVYVYIPEALLAGTKVPRDHQTLLVTRYGTKSGEIILRFRAAEPSEWDMDHEYVTRPKVLKPTPPPSFPVETAEEGTQA